MSLKGFIRFSLSEKIFSQEKMDNFLKRNNENNKVLCIFKEKNCKYFKVFEDRFEKLRNNWKEIKKDIKLKYIILFINKSFILSNKRLIKNDNSNTKLKFIMDRISNNLLYENQTNDLRNKTFFF